MLPESSLTKGKSTEQTAMPKSNSTFKSDLNPLAKEFKPASVQKNDKYVGQVSANLSFDGKLYRELNRPKKRLPRNALPPPFKPKKDEALPEKVKYVSSSQKRRHEQAKEYARQLHAEANRLAYRERLRDARIRNAAKRSDSSKSQPPLPPPKLKHQKTVSRVWNSEYGNIAPQRAMEKPTSSMNLWGDDEPSSPLFCPSTLSVTPLSPMSDERVLEEEESVISNDSETERLNEAYDILEDIQTTNLDASDFDYTSDYYTRLEEGTLFEPQPLVSNEEPRPRLEFADEEGVYRYIMPLDANNMSHDSLASTHAMFSVPVQYITDESIELYFDSISKQLYRLHIDVSPQLTTRKRAESGQQAYLCCSFCDILLHDKNYMPGEVFHQVLHTGQHPQVRFVFWHFDWKHGDIGRYPAKGYNPNWKFQNLLTHYASLALGLEWQAEIHPSLREQFTRARFLVDDVCLGRSSYQPHTEEGTFDEDMDILPHAFKSIEDQSLHTGETLKEILDDIVMHEIESNGAIFDLDDDVSVVSTTGDELRDWMRRLAAQINLTKEAVRYNNQHQAFDVREAFAINDLLHYVGLLNRIATAYMVWRDLTPEELPATVTDMLSRVEHERKKFIAQLPMRNLIFEVVLWFTPDVINNCYDFTTMVWDVLLKKDHVSRVTTFLDHFIQHLFARDWINSQKLEVIPTADFQEFLETAMESRIWKDVKEFFTSLVTLFAIKNIDNSYWKAAKDFFSNVVFVQTSVKCLSDLMKLLKRVIEGGYLWWTTGDYHAFFTADKQSQWYARSVAAIQEALVLKTEAASVDRFNEVIEELQKLIAEGDFMSIQVRLGDRESGIYRNVLDLLKNSLRQMHSVKCTALPMSPALGVHFVGESSVGKSSAVIEATTLVQRVINPDIEPSNDKIYVFNESDEFDSGHKHNQIIALFDDISTTKPQYTKRHALAALMRVINIVPAPANMAELADKGTHFHNYEMVVITSNAEHAFAGDTMTAITPVLRRMKIVIHVAIHPKHVKQISQEISGFVLDETTLNNPENDSFIKYQIWSIGVRTPKNLHECPVVPIKLEDYSTEDLPIEPLQLSEDEISKLQPQHVKRQWVTGPQGLYILKEIFIRHRQQGSKVLRSYERAFKAPLCARCGSTVCICPVLATSLMLHVRTFYAIIYLLIAKIWLGILDIPSNMKRKCRRAITNEINPILDDSIAYTIDRVMEKLEERKNEVLSRYVNVGKKGFEFMVKVMALFAGTYLAVKPFMTAKAEPTAKITQGDFSVEVNTTTVTHPYSYPGSINKFPRIPIVHVNDTFSRTVENPDPSYFAKQIRSRTYLLHVFQGDKTLGRNVAFHIYDKYFLVNDHAIGVFAEDRTLGVLIKFTSEDKTIGTMEFSWQHYKRINGFDMGLLYVPHSHQASNLLQYIAIPQNKEPMNLISTEWFRCRDCVNHIDVTPVKATPQWLGYPLAYNRVGESGSFMLQGAYTINNPIYIEDSTIGGESGSVLAQVDKNHCRLIGYQCARTRDDKRVIFTVFPSADLIHDTINSMGFLIVPQAALGVATSDISPVRGIAPHLVGPTSTAVFLGALENYSSGAPNKSAIRPSILHADVTSEYDLSEYGIPDFRSKVVQADDGTYVYMNSMLVNMSKMCVVEDGAIPSYNRILQSYQDYASKLDDPILKDRNYGGPLSVDQALNSVEPFNRLPMNTAAGFPLKGKKKSYCYQETVMENGVNQTRWRLHQKWREDYDKFEKEFLELKTTPIFTCAQKDELRKILKLLKAEIRNFNGSPFWFTLMSRRYLLPFIALFTDFPELFEHAIGINCASPAWGALHEGLDKFLYKLAGDFAGFDVRHLRAVMLFFIEFYVEAMRKYSKFTEQEIAIGVMCLYHMIHPVFLVGSEFFRTGSGMPSGCIMTLIINTFLVSMYMRLCYYAIHLGTKDPFTKNNKLRNFGDDHILGTNLKTMGLSNIKKCMAMFCQQYTHSSKKDVDFDFEDWSTITFLKRRFVEVVFDGHKFMACPLEETSIAKMLAYTDCLESDEKHQMAVLIVDAQRQYFMYGPEYFFKRQSWLRSLCDKHGIHLSPPGSQDYLKWYSYTELFQEFVGHKFSLGLA